MRALRGVGLDAILNYMARGRADDWFRQAKNDLLWSQDTLNSRRYAQACFSAQQVGGKAIKALAFARGNDEVRSRSILEISRALDENGEIERIAMRLDQYYISARYPDAFPSGAPFEFFTSDQATEAVGFAERLIELIEERFGGDEADSDQA